MLFQKKEVQNCMYRTVLIYTEIIVNHKTAVPAVWKFMWFLNVTLPCFLPLCHLEVLWACMEILTGKFSLKNLGFGSALG